MDSRAVPVIRLEIESLKHTIMSHLGARGSELGDMIEAEIDKLMINYPWQEQLEKTVHECVLKELNNYFTWGKGGRAVREAVQAAFEERNAEEEDDGTV